MNVTLKVEGFDKKMKELELAIEDELREDDTSALVLIDWFKESLAELGIFISNKCECDRDAEDDEGS